jgi:hypothetical protein
VGGWWVHRGKREHQNCDLNNSTIVIRRNIEIIQMDTELTKDKFSHCNYFNSRSSCRVIRF